MRTLLAVALASLSSCKPDALEVRFPPVATQPPLPADNDLEPQDLEPTDFCRHAGPPEFAPLVEGTDSIFSMVCAPSFTRSYAVALVTEGDEEAADRDHPRCFVRYRAAAPAGTQRAVWPTDPPASAAAEIDETSAARLRDAWESVVRRTRYPRPHYETVEIEGRVERVEWVRAGCDGTSYRFDSGKYCGTTWEPRAELTWGIVELGDALRDYALAAETYRPQKLARCLQLAQNLQAAAERRPW